MISEEEEISNEINETIQLLNVGELEEWKIQQQMLLNYLQKFVDNGFASNENVERSKDVLKSIDAILKPNLN
jgi:hypothetical protein